jgi:hypothetical protein
LRSTRQALWPIWREIVDRAAAIRANHGGKLLNLNLGRAFLGGVPDELHHQRDDLFFGSRGWLLEFVLHRLLPRFPFVYCLRLLGRVSRFALSHAATQIGR